MKRWLQDLAKLAGVLIGLYVALRIFPAEAWYIATALAVVWLFGVSRQIERMVKVVAPSSGDVSSAVKLAIPPPLRAKYLFTLQLDLDKICERLKLTEEERTTFQACERWPRAVQADQWGGVLRWRYFVRGQDAAVAEWDTQRDEWLTFWETKLDASPMFSGPRLTFDWGEGQLRLYATGGRFKTKDKFFVGPELDHTDSILLRLSFPDLNQADRAAYRDLEHQKFMTEYGGEFPKSSADDAEHFHGGKDSGVEWYAYVFDYRPEVLGTIVKRRTRNEHVVEAWRTQYLVEVGNDGERTWLPSDRIEPDENGQTQPPNGARVLLRLALDDDGRPEIVGIRPYWGVYGRAP
jgi:hypothetical protein